MPPSAMKFIPLQVSSLLHNKVISFQINRDLWILFSILGDLGAVSRDGTKKSRANSGGYLVNPRGTRVCSRFVPPVPTYYSRFTRIAFLLHRGFLSLKVDSSNLLGFRIPFLWQMMKTAIPGGICLEGWNYRTAIRYARSRQQFHLM